MTWHADPSAEGAPLEPPNEQAFSKSGKESALERRILGLLDGRLRDLAEQLFEDREIHHYQEYANIVAIKRLGYNDHGPVHMRKVALNALTMAKLLQARSVGLSMETEDTGTHDDSLLVLLLAAMLHDLGMAVTRENHENYSVTLGLPLADRYLEHYYPDDPRRRVIARSIIAECIVGHMATVRIHSREAGVILLADGCDMEKGRARIPMLLNRDPSVGDIHKYSSAAVDRIEITAGAEQPIRITVLMSESVGFFQVEEVLYPKLKMSPVKPFVELYAGIADKPLRRYA